MSWVLDYAPSRTAAEHLVLIVLAEHADKDGGNSWPAAATIARRSRLTERTVWYSLKQLRDRGIIRATGKKGTRGTTVYALSMVKPSIPETISGEAVSGERVAGLPLKPFQVTPEPVAPEPPITVLEPSLGEENPYVLAVLSILQEVDKPAFRNGKTTYKRVAEVLADYEAVDGVEVAKALRDWVTYGRGARRDVKDPVATLRNFLKRERASTATYPSTAVKCQWGNDRAKVQDHMLLECGCEKCAAEHATR